MVKTRTKISIEIKFKDTPTPAQMNVLNGHFKRIIMDSGFVLDSVTCESKVVGQSEVYK